MKHNLCLINSDLSVHPNAKLLVTLEKRSTLLFKNSYFEDICYTLVNKKRERERERERERRAEESRGEGRRKEEKRRERTARQTNKQTNKQTRENYHTTRPNYSLCAFLFRLPPHQMLTKEYYPSAACSAVPTSTYPMSYKPLYLQIAFYLLGRFQSYSW